MRIQLTFKGKAKIPKNRVNKKVNGFINKVLGGNNPYHGTISHCSVSKLQKYTTTDDNCYLFEDGAYITVSSANNKFISDFVSGLILAKDSFKIEGLVFDKFEIDEIKVNRKYDIIRTTSPIILKDKDGRFCIFKDDNFIETLTNKSRKKLMHNGVAEDVANTLEFKLFHPEKAYLAYIEFDGKKTLSSNVMLVVKGNRLARKKIYEMGLGASTSFCYGSVKVANEFELKNF